MKRLGIALVFAGVSWAVSTLVTVRAFGADVRFTDVTSDVGVRFTHNTGAYGKKLLPETMGSGVALFDADGDSDLDLLLVNGKDWPGRPTPASDTPQFYMWDSGRFVDRTKYARLEEPMYGMGVAVGDYDNDGDQDFLITCLGPNRLYRNDGQGRFDEVARQVGVDDAAFGAGAAWFDYDRDGYLDLYVCNYVEWSIENDLFCTIDGVTKAYCTPESYKGVADRLYHNNRNGTFTDVSAHAGVFDPTSKSLGVVTFDYDGDGWTDIFVTNDTEPDKLYENKGDGTFEEVGMLAGVAFDQNGIARAGMGADAADYDGSGRFSLIVGNFSNEMLSLFRNEGNGLFIDAANTARLGEPSFLTLHFGCFFFDADGDGWEDIFVANGHVENEISRVQRQVTYAQTPHLFVSTDGASRFVDVAKDAGFTEALVGRGAAYGDIDNDGDPDVVMTTSGGAAKVYRNDTESGNRLRVRLEGRDANPDAVGALVSVHSGTRVQRGMIKGGGSYCSQSEQTLSFGLGVAESASRVEIVFPGGRQVSLRDVECGQTIVVSDTEGLVGATPFARPSRRGDKS